MPENAVSKEVSTFQDDAKTTAREVRSQEALHLLHCHLCLVIGVCLSTRVTDASDTHPSLSCPTSPLCISIVLISIVRINTEEQYVTYLVKFTPAHQPGHLIPCFILFEADDTLLFLAIRIHTIFLRRRECKHAPNGMCHATAAGFAGRAHAAGTLNG
jgi:hypothetical protein